jgi:hypothetical protein
VPRALLAIVGIALVVRLVHVASVATFERTHVVPGLDQWLDIEIAESVAAGDPLGGPLASYDSAPAYALLLGLAHRALGGGWTAPLVLQALLGAAVPLLLYATGRRVAGTSAGLAAAALAAVYAPAIFYEGLTVKFALLPFALSALLCALAATVDGVRPSGPALAAGAALALTVALRPNGVVLLPIALAWIAARHPPRVAAKAILLFGVGLALVAVPLAVRRSLAAARGDAASLWGIHFYVGSQVTGDGGYTPVAGVADDVFGHVDDARAVAEEASGRPLTPAEVSHYWFDRGIEEIARDPSAYVRLLGRKLRRLVAVGEEGDFGDDWTLYAAESPVLRAGIGFGAVAPLAALGALIGLRRTGLAWCTALAGAYGLSLLPFFVTGRYRLPIVPPAIVLAGAGLAWLIGAAAGRRPMAFVVPVLLIGGAAGLGAAPAELLRLVGVLTVAVVAAVWRARGT